jgi:Protein of unknwon function (DUF3310)
MTSLCGQNGCHRPPHEGPCYATETEADMVNHPKHYTAHPSGVECVDIAEYMTFNVGNAVKYLWRSGLKTKDPIEDLKKAAWYIQREIERLTKKKVRT